MLGSRIDDKYNTTAGVSRSGRPGIFTETAKGLQNRKEGMNVRIKLSPEDD